MLLWLLRLGLLLLAVTGCLTAAFVLYGRWQDAQQRQVLIEGGDPSLSPVERVYLQAYLTARVDALQEAAGDSHTAVDFVIAPGETADTIAANLAELQMLSDTELFLNYVRYYGLDSELEAGNFRLIPPLTIPELAATLTRSFAQEVEVRFVEGWRVEEMADHLSQTTPADISAVTFLALTQRQTPFDLSDYDFLGSLPDGASLEGFLFPDTYRLPLDADAAHLVDLMLQNFGRRVTPTMRQSYGVRGLTLYQAVTLASIVEREAALPVERPLIASVFYNRLAQNMKLEADPTIQYAVGYQQESNSWWKSPLSVADLDLQSPYNTYVVDGLPPSPIANPGLDALQAVAQPAETDYLFFVVDCTATVAGKHVFSSTFEEHLANVERCQ